MAFPVARAAQKNGQPKPSDEARPVQQNGRFIEPMPESFKRILRDHGQTEFKKFVTEGQGGQEVINALVEFFETVGRRDNNGNPKEITVSDVILGIASGEITSKYLERLMKILREPQSGVLDLMQLMEEIRRTEVLPSE